MGNQLINIFLKGSFVLSCIEQSLQPCIVYCRVREIAWGVLDGLGVCTGRTCLALMEFFGLMAVNFFPADLDQLTFGSGFVVFLTLSLFAFLFFVSWRG